MRVVSLITEPGLIVTVADAPNDETMAKLSLLLGSKGNIRTRTLCAFSEAEYRKVVSSLP